MSDEEHNIGDKPIEGEHREAMRLIAKTVDDIFNGEKARTPEAEIGFILMTFPFGDYDGRTNYISNCRPEDVEGLLADQLVRIRERREQGNA